MAGITTVQSNQRQLQQLAAYSNMGNDMLDDAWANLGAIDEKRVVVVETPRAAAAVAQIRRAVLLLDKAGDIAAQLPAGESVRFARRGAAAMDKVERLIAGPTISPRRVSQLLPTYQFQEAGLAASEEYDSINEALGLVANEEGVVPKTISPARLGSAISDARRMRVAADAALKDLETAKGIADSGIETTRKIYKIPAGREVMVERHLIEGWGVAPLARESLGNLDKAVKQFDVPPHSSVNTEAEAARDALDTIYPSPTRGSRTAPSSIPASELTRALSNSAHHVALARNEAQTDYESLKVLERYGSRA